MDAFLLAVLNADRGDAEQHEGESPDPDLEAKGIPGIGHEEVAVDERRASRA
jgi:hypothetical protein